MERVKFNNCLNKETKYWNVPLLALLIGGLMGGLAGLAKGLVWFFGFGTVGFVMGCWLSHQWWLGNLQRRCYWNLPFNSLLIDKRVPNSHDRNLI